MTTLLPNASKPFTRMLRKLDPYAINNVTVTMPQTIPAMVRTVRVWLRFSAVQDSRMICVSIRTNRTTEGTEVYRISFVLVCVLCVYPPASYLNASMGSIDAARRAG